MSRNGRYRWLDVARRVSQIGFAAFILVAAVRHHTSAVHVPSLHAYCPFGVIGSLGTLITTGKFAPKIHTSSLVLGVAVLVSAFMVGSAFCGWVCPLGSLGDALEWVRRKLHLPEVKVPKKLERVLSYGRYAMLIGIIWATMSTAKLWFGAIDPYYAIFSLDWLFELNWAEYWPGYLVALGIVVGGLFIPRIWCRFLCPLGGLLSLIERVSPIKIRRNAHTCIDCGRCDGVCPTRIEVSSCQSVTHDCVMCLRCVQACPVSGALEVALPGFGQDNESEEVN